MAEETRIVKIEIDQSQALKNLEQSELAIRALKNEQKELNDQLKESKITEQEYAAQKVQLDQKISAETANRKKLTETINTESNSLAAQKLKLKELISERDKIDRSTVEGAKKFDDMNKSIKSLNGSIQAAEQAGGSFQRNVGNYKGTIDQFTGGAYSAAEGLMGMVRASLAFIATPIGAIIAAIGVALGALTAYFRGSEEGQNNLNKIMTAGGIVMEKIMDVVEGLGKAIFEAFSNPKQALLDLYNFLKDNIINRFTAFKVILEGILDLDVKKIGDGLIQASTGIENATDKVANFAKETAKTVDAAIQDGLALAKMEADLDKKERKLLTDAAKNKLEISKLRKQADESEGQARLDFINQALELEKQNAQQELDNAQLRRDIAAENVRLRGDDKEALNALAKAEADLDNTKTAFFENTRKMNKERISLEEQLRNEAQKTSDAEIKLEADRQARADKELENTQKWFEKNKDAIKSEEEILAESLMINLENVEEEAKAEQDAANKTYENYKDNEEKKREENKKTKDQILDATNYVFDTTSDILKKMTDFRNAQALQQADNFKINQQKELAALQERLDKGEISEEEYKKEKTRIEKEGAQAIEDYRRKAFEQNKKTQIAEAIINAIQSSLKALAQLGPIFGAIPAAAALVFGYKQVDLIRDQQYVPGSFSIGGYTGDGGVNDPAGIVHKGEVVWNQRDVAAVGGPQMADRMRPTWKGYAMGGIVTDMITSQIDGRTQSMNGTTPVYLSLAELNKEQNKLAQKAQIVEV